MMEIERKPFNSIILKNEMEELIKIEVGFNISFVTDEDGQSFEGTVIKIAAKEITIKSVDDSFYKIFNYATITNVKIVEED